MPALREEKRIRNAIIASAVCVLLALGSLYIAISIGFYHEAVMAVGLFGFMAFVGAAILSAYEAWTKRDKLTITGLQAHARNIDVLGVARQFGKRRRITLGVVAFSWGLALVSAAIAYQNAGRSDVVVIATSATALVSFGFGAAYLAYGYRCPACNIILKQDGIDLFPESCPRCGVRLRTSI